MTTLILVRHGTTDWVEIDRLHGITDIPLNDQGHQQAKNAAYSLERSEATSLYSSSLSRCIETAQAISRATGLELVPMDELVEINFGWLEGSKLRAFSTEEHSRLVKRLDHWKFQIIRGISGEPNRNLARRVRAGLERILKESQGQTAIVVAHSGIINTILRYYFEKAYLNPGDTYYHLMPGSITELKFDGDKKPIIIRLNDCAHLAGGNP